MFSSVPSELFASTFAELGIVGLPVHAFLLLSQNRGVRFILTLFPGGFVR